MYMKTCVYIRDLSL